MVGSIILTATLTLAVYLDVSRRWLPNWLTVPLALAGLVHGGVSGGLPALQGRTLGLAVLLVLFAVLWQFGACRGGDVKLCAAAGAWLGFRLVPLYLFSWVVINAVAVLFACWKGNGYSVRSMWQEQRSSVQGLLVGLLHRENAYSYPGAVAIALAVLAASVFTI